MFTDDTGKTFKTFKGEWNTNKYPKAPDRYETPPLEVGKMTTVGSIDWHLGTMHLRSVDLKPGKYTVRFERIMVDHPSPTGAIHIEIVERADKPPPDETAWGKAVDGVEFGIEFKDQRKAYRVGDWVTLSPRSNWRSRKR